jgi:IMP and pyridine-specific 5'-nucleotidase
LQVEKYEYRLSGLLRYFQTRGLSQEECERFYIFGGECNYLLHLGNDYRLHPVREYGPGGWMTSTKFLPEAPANWTESQVCELLDAAEAQVTATLEELNLRGQIIRKRRSVGLVPRPGQEIPRESLDEVVLRAHEDLQRLNGGKGPGLPYCAFNGGSDCWVDAGNKRVGVQVLQSYLGVPADETLHIGDQFLNTGNDYAARDVSPCVWIINPNETTYILKSILRLAGLSVFTPEDANKDDSVIAHNGHHGDDNTPCIDFQEMERRDQAAKRMDVYTGDLSNG